ncbi:hypothetical protein BD779DRAFT_1065493 [Infundibulicybe gibba]|nr:hypothetical protein BD779DRAFT_1065493 [Infundibulicybe gibba]
MPLPVHERPRGSVADLISRFEPLKPHHTGQSATSEHKAASTAASPTPSRPKTLTTIVRPKTPLDPPAPTAASLARARNAQPQLPAPMGDPEVHLGGSSADHLSNSTMVSFNHAHHLHLSGSTEVGSHDQSDTRHSFGPVRLPLPLEQSTPARFQAID